MMLDNFEVSCENHTLKARVLLLPKTTHNLARGADERLRAALWISVNLQGTMFVKWVADLLSTSLEPFETRRPICQFDSKP
ncbi:hypothetical protein N7530_002181 [Penicillium desertorum]|uniref:Uncharacterized protein n=1 Tax=Penicillium desertorum TaxID=1303715 RepID=A0A9W9XBZ3_9EURO|nr:hypothetical protein N7530_002181 [Penicillium desertorum]